MDFPHYKKGCQMSRRRLAISIVLFPIFLENVSARPIDNSTVVNAQVTCAERSEKGSRLQSCRLG